VKSLATILKKLAMVNENPTAQTPIALEELPARIEHILNDAL